MHDASAGRNLKSYRLYFLDRQRGHIKGFHELEAADDAAAMEQAERFRIDQPMELWCRARKVKHWPGLFTAPSKEADEPQTS